MSGLPLGRRRPLPKPRRPDAGADACDLQFTVDLIGIRRDVVAQVRAGDALAVSLVSEKAMVSAVCRTGDGAVVGALAAFPGLARLLSCLEQEVSYVAHVEEVAPARCVVTVSRTDP